MHDSLTPSLSVLSCFAFLRLSLRAKLFLESVSMCSFLPISSPAPALPGNPLPAAWRLRSRHSTGMPTALRIVFALRGGGETPPRPHFRQSVIRKSHRQGVSGLRDSFAGPRLGFAKQSAAPAERRPSFASLREGRGSGVGSG